MARGTTPIGIPPPHSTRARTDPKACPHSPSGPQKDIGMCSRRPGGRRPQTPTLATDAPTSASGSPSADVRPPLRSSDLGATRDYLPNSFLFFVINTPRSPKTASIPTCVTYLYGSGSGSSSSHFTLNCIASELITCILLLINENTRCN